jgi:hypothetical protein
MCDDDDEAEAWRWLMTLVKTLDVDGTSSDESEEEGALELKYRIKALPWRRNIRRELDLIDATRTEQPTAYSPRGSKPVRRYWNERNPVSTRQAAKRLPKELYDADWFEDNPALAERAHASPNSFKWAKILHRR